MASTTKGLSVVNSLLMASPPPVLEVRVYTARLMLAVTADAQERGDVRVAAQET